VEFHKLAILLEAVVVEMLQEIPIPTGKAALEERE
jgi:hypothetical protein